MTGRSVLVLALVAGGSPPVGMSKCLHVGGMCSGHLVVLTHSVRRTVLGWHGRVTVPPPFQGC
jgi:hypothetical protein